MQIKDKETENIHCTCTLHFSNLQKTAKKVRREQEKEYMNSLTGFGEAVGEYSGHGRGEEDDTTLVDHQDDMECRDDMNDDDAEWMDTCDTVTDTCDSTPLHILFDIETTGLSTLVYMMTTSLRLEQRLLEYHNHSLARHHLALLSTLLVTSPNQVL